MQATQNQPAKPPKTQTPKTSGGMLLPSVSVKQDVDVGKLKFLVCLFLLEL